jgi:hypothetical protein
MRDIVSALRLETVAEIEDEIQHRRALIVVMVGWLYPQILRDEIGKLATRKLYLLEKEGVCGSRQ